MRPQHNTKLALIGRLAERGTQRYPDLQSTNRYVDALYGATYSATVDGYGAYQLLHLSWQCLDDRFTLSGESIWPQGVAFLRDVLLDPAGPKQSFRPADLDQEKAALSQNIQSLNNDKSGYAYRRCKDILCQTEACSLPAHGDVADFDQINAKELWHFQKDIASTNALEFFLSGPITAKQASEVIYESLYEVIQGREVFNPVKTLGERLALGTEQWEHQDLAQGRLVMGGHTGISLSAAQFPTLVLFNALLGGDSNSRLFRRVREEAGLAYHIQSFLEPLNGLMFIETACSQEDYGKARYLIDVTMADLVNQTVHSEELARVVQGAIQSLKALEDSPEGMMYYHLRQYLAGITRSREQLIGDLKNVTPGDIQSVAAWVHFEAVFFLK